MTHEQIWQAGYDAGFRHGKSEGRTEQVLRTAMLDRLEIQRLREQMERELPNKYRLAIGSVTIQEATQ